MRKQLVVLCLLLVFSLGRTGSVQAQSADAKALLEQSAKAMGGMQALRSLKNQVVESEGKQYDSSSTPRPGGAPDKHFSLHVDKGSYPAAAEA